MNRTLQISLIRLITVNLIPVIGALLLDWKLFEIGVTYVMETAAIFLVFELDHYFIDKRTRLPFPFAVLQLVFTLLTFSALMLGMIFVIYELVTPPHYNAEVYNFRREHAIFSIHTLTSLPFFFIIELIVYYIRKNRIEAYFHQNTWRVLRRIFFSQLYIAVCVIILGMFPQNMLVLIPFFIGLKLVLEYSTEDERLFKALWEKFKNTRFYKYFEADPTEKKARHGYLPKKRTYIRRTHSK